jgi:surface antigen
MLRRIMAIALFGVSLAACAGNPWGGTSPRENPSTLVGAAPVIGSQPGAAPDVVMGSQPGGGTGETIAAPARPPTQAAIAGLIGNRMGAAMDDEDKQRAYAAQVQALETGQAGAPTAWRNPDSGRYGSIVPGPAYDSRGMKCRQYTHTIYIDAKPQTARAAACRNPDGSWSPAA